MRFKVGDKVWSYMIGLKEAEVTGVYPNTDRYKIKHSWEHYEKAKNVYGSPEEYYQEELINVNKRIESLKEKRNKILDELEQG